MNGTQIEKMLRKHNETNSKRYAHFKQYYCSKKDYKKKLYKIGSYTMFFLGKKNE